jgi:hypothetical protein
MGFTYAFGALLCAFLVLFGLELFACVCLVLLLRVFAIISSSPLFLGRSCVPLLLCGFVTRRRSSPLHKGFPVVFFPNSTLHSFSLNVVCLACLTPLSCASLHLNCFYAISETLSFFFRRPYVGVIDRKCRGFDRSEM